MHLILRKTEDHLHEFVWRSWWRQLKDVERHKELYTDVIESGTDTFQMTSLTTIPGGLQWVWTDRATEHFKDEVRAWKSLACQDYIVWRQPFQQALPSVSREKSRRKLWKPFVIWRYPLWRTAVLTWPRYLAILHRHHRRSFSRCCRRPRMTTLLPFAIIIDEWQQTCGFHGSPPKNSVRIVNKGWPPTASSTRYHK